MQQQVVDMFANVSLELSSAIADEIGAILPQGEVSEVMKSSPTLSQVNTKKMPKTRKVGVIISSDFNGADVLAVLNALRAEGIQIEIISDKLGTRKGSDGTELEVNHTFLTGESVLFDGIYAVGGNVECKKFNQNAAYFINEAFSHFKPIGATHEGKKWLEDGNLINSPGVVIGDDMREFAENFVKAISAHRHWNRQIV